jgi:hypothetical protein
MISDQDLLRGALQAAPPAGLPSISFEAIAAEVAQAYEGRSGRRPVRTVLAVVVSTLTVLAIVVVALSVRSNPPAHQSRVPAAKLAPLPTYQGISVIASTLATYQWRRLPKAPIADRHNSAAVWTGHELIVWGGEDDPRAMSDGAAYNPATRTWSVLPAGPLTARTQPLATWVDGTMVIWGGIVRSSRLSDGASYNPATRTWRSLPEPPSVPSGNVLSKLVTIGNLAVLIRTPDYTAGTNTIYLDAFNPNTNTWTRLPSYTPPLGHVIVAGDALAAGDNVFLWSYWTTVNQIGARTGPGATDAAVLNVANGKWSPIATTPDRGESAGEAVWTGSAILLPQRIGFCNCMPGRQPAVTSVLIDPVTGLRSTIQPGPASRSILHEVWTGGSLVAFAAGTRGGPPSIAAAWDPTTKHWTALAGPSTGDAAYSVAIWTGNELMLWGQNSTASGTGVELAPK